MESIPRGSKFQLQSPAVQKAAVWVTANWRGGIPNILWNSFIILQVSTPCWESPFLQQHEVLAILFLCMTPVFSDHLQPLQPLFTWKSILSITV